jgi:hypothetical protein
VCDRPPGGNRHTMKQQAPATVSSRRLHGDHAIVVLSP